MLSIAAVTSSAKAGHYFNQDNYYAKNSQEAKEASAWWGKGAAAFELEGEVNIEAFKQVLDGKLPNGSVLGVVKDGERQHRPGYDLSFSAPKSVSLLALVGGDERLIRAHQAAVKTTLGIIESEVATARTTEQGKTRYESTGNLIGALFLHDTSRALDPQLHTHAVVMNATIRADGQVRALATQSDAQVRKGGLQGFSEKLYHRKLHFGAVYRFELAKAVKALGYEIEETHRDGRFEIAGIDKDVLDAFSRRRKEIEAAMSERGLSGAKDAALATLMTREAKRALPREELHQYWQDRSQAHGFHPSLLIGASKQQAIEALAVTPEKTAQIASNVVTYACKHLAEREAVFSHDALFDVAKCYALGQVGYTDIRAAIDKAYTSGELLHAATLDGKLHATTQEALDLERSNIELVQQGKDAITPIMPRATAECVVMSRSLTMGQMDAIKLILSTSDQIIGVQGFAGTGKTTMLATVKELAELKGYTIKGMAPTAPAAETLSKELGIDTQTVDKFIIDQSNELALSDSECSKEIWLLDEASMVSSRRYNELLTLIRASDSLLVNIGDVQQLPSVEAGKPFAQSQKAGMSTAIMKDILRQQKDSLLYQSVHDAINGVMSAAIDKLGNNLSEVPDKEARLSAVSAHFLGLSPEERRETLVITPANDDREAMNQLIREGLQKEGALGVTISKRPILKSVNYTLVEKTHIRNYKQGFIVRFNRSSSELGIERGHYYKIGKSEETSNTVTLINEQGHKVQWQPHRFAGGTRGAVEVFEQDKRGLAVGERIRWTRNFKDDGKLNSQEAKVLGIEGSRVHVELANGKVSIFDMADKQHQHWDYAYASTAYTAQGKTVNRVIAHDESFRKHLTTQRAFYVIISRAREEAFLYVDDKQKYTQQLERVVGDKTSSLESIVFGESEAIRELAIDRVTTLAQVDAPTEALPNPDSVATPLPPKQAPVFYDLDAITTRLNQQAETIVERILGEPNRKLSNQRQWRYGTKGSLSITLQGEKRGCWHSFETGESGHLIQLIQREHASTFKDALTVAANWLGLTPGVAPTMTKAKTTIKPSNEPNQPSVEDKRAMAKAQKLWEKTQPIEGSLAERYLREHRGIHLESLPKTFRFMPAYYHGMEKKAYPALMVAATNREGKVEAVQVVCLDKATANKAQIEVVKVTHGRLRFGAAVQLNPVHSEKLYAAEGPETALSVMSAVPDAAVVACLSKANFKQLTPVVDGQQGLVLCGDNDGNVKDSKAALHATVSHLASRFQSIGIAIPEESHADFNDVHRQNGLALVKDALQNATKSLVQSQQKQSQTLSELLPKADSKSVVTKQQTVLNQLMHPAQNNSAIGRNQHVSFEQLMKQSANQLDKTIEIEGA